jgi:very-short-patch-repair endonuclease
MEMPREHLTGSGCKKCGIEKTKKYTVLGKDKFIEIANKIHNNKYIYDNVEYINSYTPVEIICPKHGPFFQKPNDHISSKCGCPICSESKGERQIRIILKSLKISFVQEKKFCDLKHKNCLYFDFYLPDLNVCIEFDGEQHFAPFDIFGGEESFNIIQIKDKLKNEYCEKNNIRLLRITYLDENIEKIIKDFFFIREHKILRFKSF